MIKKYFYKFFVEQTDSTTMQFLRYSLVGGIGFVADTATFLILKRSAGVNYQLAGLIGFIVGLVITYALSVGWVFKHSRTVLNRYKEFMIFTVIGIIGLGLNALFLWIFYDRLHLVDVVAKIVSAALVYIWNFSVRKILLFSASEPASKISNPPQA